VGKDKGTSVAYESVATAAKNYLPSVNRILITCKVQPEVARLDEKLVFEWCSGIEHEKKYFKSEALMYELVMTVGCEAMAKAGSACDYSIDGEFAASSREFQAAAGMFQRLATDQLPKWISRGSSVEQKDIPLESRVGVCEAFKTLFLAIAQQMAVATVLIKPGVPKYSLVGKLCLGIADQMETFVSVMRSKAPESMEKIDNNLFTLITFQINLHKGLSNYFMARGIWETHADYGLAIAMMNGAIQLIKTREHSGMEGLPEIKKTPLQSLSKDLTDLRAHMALVLREWEKDNSQIYFSRVPRTIPEEKKLQKGLVMVKPTPYDIEEVEPALLILPSARASLGRPIAPPPPAHNSDEEYARELQRRLNMG